MVTDYFGSQVFDNGKTTKIDVGINFNLNKCKKMYTFPKHTVNIYMVCPQQYHTDISPITPLYLGLHLS